MSNRKRGEASERESAAGLGGSVSEPIAEPVEQAAESAGRDPETAEVERLRAREDELLRALAEQQNVMRRRRQEMDSAIVHAQEELVGDLLPVLDDFERALKAMEGKADDAIRSGVALVYDRLVRILERQGLTPIRPIGEPFDPALHDALAERAGTNAAPGTIVEVVQSGYRFRDRVLRHAKVVVAADSAGPTSAHPRAAR